MTKSVKILVDPSDLASLKENKYRLCFAKKVNNTYNVVWQSYTDFIHQNSFSWTPVYQLFGTNTFQDNVTVDVETNAVSILLGQGATLDQDGNLGPASTQNPPTAISMTNEYGPIHPGLNQLSISPNGKSSVTPVYVGEYQIELGKDQLTPVDKVQVWFEQNVETSTMFSDDRTKITEIDLTFVDSGTRLYKNGVWVVPSYAAELSPILTVIVVATGTVSAALIANAITAKLTGVYQYLMVDVSVTDQKFIVKYSQKPGLSEEERAFFGTLLKSDTTRDELMEFTLQAFSANGLGFQSINAE
jgi:hypothetical protein